MEAVKNGLSRIPDVTVYTRDTLPERFHYSKPVQRLGDIIAIPNEGGVVMSEVSEGKLQSI